MGKTETMHVRPTLSAHVPAPLTEAQTGLWYAQRLDLTNPIFNTGEYIDLRGQLDVAAFTQAVDAAMAETDALAIRVIDAAEAPMQVVDESLRPALHVVDLRGDPEPWTAARSRMQADMEMPVDPTRGPLAAQRLFILDDDHHVWYQRVHHLAADGFGMALLVNRVAQLYAVHTGASVDAGQPLTPYSAALNEDAAYREGELRERDRAFWLNAFAQPAAIASLADGVPITSHRFVQASAPLDESLISALRKAETDSNVAWPDILAALSAAYLCRHAGQSATTIGLPWMGRLGSSAARVPTMLMNIVPVQVAVDEDAPLNDFLIETARIIRRARRHGRYRSEQLRRDLGLLGGRKRVYGPLVNVLPFDADWQLPGVQATRHLLGTGPVDDLNIGFRADPTAGGLRLSIDANAALYRQADVDAHFQRLSAFLAAALSAVSLAEVPTLTADETRHWLHGVNDTDHPVPQSTLVAHIEAAMRRHAASPALRFDGRTLDYAELDARTQALAQQLRARGVQRGDIVAIAIPRSLELVIALVAVLRAGAAYLPLDISHPRERLAAILRSAEPRLALTVASVASVLPEVVPVLHLDADAPNCVAEGGHLAVSNPANLAEGDRLDAPNPASLTDGDRFDALNDTRLAEGGERQPSNAAGEPAGPFDPAYVIYTSGSTGAPKGVVVEHDAIVNRLEWMRTHYGIGANERILQKTPATFDVSVWEFFLPLMAGALLVVAPPDAHKDPAWLATLVRDEGITTLHFVPSMLAAFLTEPSAAGMHMPRVFCSGEELPAALRDRFHATVTGELHNLYGPTEAAVDVSYWPASADDRSQPVPIGLPVWNTALYVLDDRMRPVPAGVAGHLYLAGRQLARGYLGRPDLTDARFLPDPFRPGGRMYATGDLARWRDDGAMIFLGRSDHQVKIRGQRIELGEIESVLAADANVDHVAVIVRTDRPGDQLIAAYVVPVAGAAFDADALRSRAAAHLPEYMVPSAFVELAALPVTANGKLDRNALPAPAFAVRAGRPAAEGTEQTVAGLFAEVLGREDAIGADDDFFDLGGHSLLAARLALAIRQRWGQALGLGAVFEHPTVARLAAYLDARAGGQGSQDGNEGFGPVIALRQGDAAHLPLFCLHPAGGISWCYGTLARAMDAPRTVYGLQARALDPALAELPDSMNAMAEAYADTIQRLQPAGPVHLLGWSVGGIVAHAIAVVLKGRGREVGMLAMLDAYPSDVWRDQPDPPEDAVYKALLHIAGHDPASMDRSMLTRDGVIDFLRASGHPLGELSDAMLDGVFRVVAGNNRLVREHDHDRFDGTVLYFRAALDHVGLNLSPKQWSGYATTIDVHDVPALHAHLTGAQATARIAPVVNAALAQADAAWAGR